MSAPTTDRRNPQGDSKHGKRGSATLETAQAVVATLMVRLPRLYARLLAMSTTLALLILMNVPFRVDRWHPGGVADRHRLQRLGRHRLHRAIRPGGAERRRDGQLLQ